MRILPPQTTVARFSGETTSPRFTQYIKNGVLDKLPDGRPYLRHRAAFRLEDDATGVGTNGQGIYYWRDQDAYYVVNNGVVYVYTNAYGASKGNTSSTAGRANITEVGDYLFILHSKGNKAYTVTGTGNAAEITDTDFPPNDTPALTLAGGNVSLNSRGYVLDTDGTLHGSDSGDVTAWNALNVITAQRTKGKGVYCARHHDNVAVFKTDSLSFFYDAANATGSPLSRRNDVYFNVGMLDRPNDLACGLVEHGDDIYFIGRVGDAIQLYKLSNFSLTVVSTPDISAIIAAFSYSASSDRGVVLTSYSHGGHEFIRISILTLNSIFTFSLEYDVTMSTSEAPVWYWSDTVHGNFFISSTNTNKTDSSVKQKLLDEGGEVFTVEDDWRDKNSAGTQTAISMIIQHPLWDGGESRYKYVNWLMPVYAMEGQADYSVQIDISDEVYSPYAGGFTSSSDEPEQIPAMGRFRSRSHLITVATVSASALPFRYEGLDISVKLGSV